MSRSGRSTLLEMNAPAPVRARPWWRRRLASLACALALAALAVAVGTEALSPGGPARAVYAAHDALWVPFWSWLWVRNGFGSLLWWLPLALIAALALAEFLGVGRPLRRLQVMMLRAGLRGGIAPGVLRFQRRLGRDRDRLAVAVLHADAVRACAAVRGAVESGTAVDTGALARAVTGLAALRPDDAALHLRAAEAAALIERLEGPAGAAGLRGSLRRIWPEPVADDILAALDLRPEAAPAALSALVAGHMRPARLALATLAMARGAQALPPGIVRGWFGEWARLSHRPDAPHPELAAAEQLIDFEFWAALAERRLRDVEVTGDRAGWFAALLPEVEMRPAMGEAAAAGLPQAVPR